ncbi:MAG TPA: hypothetical protein V6C58_18165 [Allocoleopsis sp.]
MRINPALMRAIAFYYGRSLFMRAIAFCVGDRFLCGRSLVVGAIVFRGDRARLLWAITFD